MPKFLRIPSYRFHKASRQAVVVLDGRSHYLGGWNTPESRAEYDRISAEWLADRRRRMINGPRTRPAPSDQTINELIPAFLDFAENHYLAPDGKPTRHLNNLRDALKPVRVLARIDPGPGLRPRDATGRPRGGDPSRDLPPDHQ